MIVVGGEGPHGTLGDIWSFNMGRSQFFPPPPPEMTCWTNSSQIRKVVLDRDQRRGEEET